MQREACLTQLDGWMVTDRLAATNKHSLKHVTDKIAMQRSRDETLLTAPGDRPDGQPAANMAALAIAVVCLVGIGMAVGIVVIRL